MVTAGTSGAESALVVAAGRKTEMGEGREKLDEQSRELTDHGEEHGMTYGRRGGHLTLVCAGIPPLRIFHLQRPVLRVREVRRDESLVGRVRLDAHREEMDIPVPHP